MIRIALARVAGMFFGFWSWLINANLLCQQQQPNHGCGSATHITEYIICYNICTIQYLDLYIYIEVRVYLRPTYYVLYNWEGMRRLNEPFRCRCDAVRYIWMSVCVCMHFGVRERDWTAQHWEQTLKIDICILLFLNVSLL